jgi:phosphoribosylglycinamide formyltransferase-1
VKGVAMSSVNPNISWNSSQCKWAVFISGNGSNLQALIDAQPPVSIALVVSNKAEALGVGRARKAGIPVKILPKEISWFDLSADLKANQIERIFLAGFMKVIPESFIQDWPLKILNLHPSLLPNYKGLRAIERSYADGAAMGVTVHWVIPDLDAGPVLLQKEVFTAQEAKSLSIEQVKEKIHQVENQMVVEAVRRCSQ